ncbi:MAG: hypothetical protein QXK94_04740, partial [Candidatus Jordarchaeales archaeon]
SQARLEERQARLEEAQARLEAALARLSESQARLEERQARLEEAQARLEAALARLSESQARLEERQARLEEELLRLREDFNKMLARIERLEEIQFRMDERLTRMEATLDKLTLDIEEEARSVVKWRLREMGYDIEVGPLMLPDGEINIYGVSDGLCVIGEVSVRAGVKLVDEVVRKAAFLERKYPEKIRPRKILLIYTSWIPYEAIEEAKKKGVWVLKATGDITPPKLTS